LASSRGTSNGPDMRDIAVTWEAFEEINDCVVTVAMTLVKAKGDHEVILSGAAWEKDLRNLITGQQLLASAICSATHYVSLENALFHLLYTLDGNIASAELEGKGKKEA